MKSLKMKFNEGERLCDRRKVKQNSTQQQYMSVIRNTIDKVYRKDKLTMMIFCICSQVECMLWCIGLEEEKSWDTTDGAAGTDKIGEVSLKR